MNNQENGINPDVKSLQEKLAAAEAAGAEMRHLLDKALPFLGHFLGEQVQYALKSTPIGTGWKSPAEVAILEATLEQRTNEANLATETAKKLSENLWKWSRGLIGQSPFTPDELKEMFGPYVEEGITKGLHPREARLLETLIQTGAANVMIEEDRDKAAAARDTYKAELDRRDAIPTDSNEWRTWLQGWGGTPKIVNDFIKGQQDRIHYFQNLEADLEKATKERDIAEAILKKRGYEQCPGPARWKPPLGSSPILLLEKIDQLTKELADANDSRTNSARWISKIADLLGWNAEKSNADLRQFVEDGIDQLTKERDGADERLESADTEFRNICRLFGVELTDEWMPVREVTELVQIKVSALRSEIERKDAALKAFQYATSESGMAERQGECDPALERAQALYNAALTPAEKEAAAHEQHISQQGKPEAESVQSVESAHKQYRDLIPGADRWKQGDEEFSFRTNEWNPVSSNAFGSIAKPIIAARRPLPEVPEGWEVNGGHIERVGDGVWLIDERFKGHLHEDAIGQPSVKRFCYRLPRPPKAAPATALDLLKEAAVVARKCDGIEPINELANKIEAFFKSSLPEIPDNSSHSEIPNNSLWISQPTEAGWWWYRRDDAPDEIVRIVHDCDELLIEEIGLAKFVPVTSCLNKGQFFGQFQGPIKPQEGWK